MNKNLIIFTDSGDTIIDESTQIFDERGIVTEAEFIPGAGEVLQQLQEEGIVLPWWQTENGSLFRMCIAEMVWVIVLKSGLSLR